MVGVVQTAAPDFAGVGNDRQHLYRRERAVGLAACNRPGRFGERVGREQGLQISVALAEQRTEVDNAVADDCTVTVLSVADEAGEFQFNLPDGQWPTMSYRTAVEGAAAAASRG